MVTKGSFCGSQAAAFGLDDQNQQHEAAHWERYSAKDAKFYR